MARVNLRTVAELLGHRMLQLVMRFAPEHQPSAVDRQARLQEWKGHQSIREEIPSTTLNTELLKNYR